MNTLRYLISQNSLEQLFHALAAALLALLVLLFARCVVIS